MAGIADWPVVEEPPVYDEETGILLNNLQLWLRADKDVVIEGDVVTLWKDQSKGNDAKAEAGTAPTLAENEILGMPGVVFETASFMTVAHDPGLNAGKGLTVFAVYRQDGGNRLFQKGDGNGLTAKDWMYVGSRGLGVAGSYWSDKHGSTIYTATSDRVYVASNVFNRKTGTINYYESGTEMASVDGVTALEENTDDLFIGKRNNHGSESGWRGQLFEVLIYNRALSDADRALVEEYLLDKYQIPADPEA